MARSLARMIGPFVRWWVPKRLGGYRIQVNSIDVTRPSKLSKPRRAAIIGGGLAGLSAAHTLAQAGFDVTLFEKNGHLGGKLGSWTTKLPNGEVLPTSHGFHAFFRSYYNLTKFLEETGANKHFRPIDDYLILGPKGRRLSIAATDSTPILNLLALADSGFYRFRDIYLTQARNHMDVFMAYDINHTHETYDHESFVDFADRAEIPAGLRLAFSIIARAFFADEDKLSFAELLKSFHVYYFSNDHGLAYDYPSKDYSVSILQPITHTLTRMGVHFHLGTSIDQIERQVQGFKINNRLFDYAIIATDIVGTRAIVEASPGLVLPDARARLTQLVPGQRYAVLRLWIDRDITENVPVFVITDREHILDAFAIYHRIEDEARDWVTQNGGGVIELHSYALPDELYEPAEVRAALLKELPSFLPSLSGMKIKHESLQVEHNFTAFHVGMHSDRPSVADGGDRLSFAGDWVKLPFPAMLMEAACASGIVAANRARRAEGIQEAPVWSVPPRGLLAKSPKRSALLHSSI